MRKGTGSIIFLALLSGLGVACSDDSTTSPGGGGAAAGGGNVASGSGGIAAGGSSGGSAGAAGSSTTGGGGASNGGASSGGASSGGAATGGQGGASGGSAGAAGATGAAGGPPSTDGLPFVGSCLSATHCTDEWDTMFGAATLEQLCVGQQGTWSTGHCATGSWTKKCTQAVLGGVYVQYLPPNGACVLGFEEPL